jgi:chromosome segregation ATPase
MNSNTNYNNLNNSKPSYNFNNQNNQNQNSPNNSINNNNNNQQNLREKKIPIRIKSKSGKSPINQSGYQSDNNNNNNNNNTNNNNNNININDLRTKIKEEAHRLQNLESYKLICERRIRQLVPTHQFPVKEEDILSNLNKNNNLNFDENAYLTLLENKEDEISALKSEVEKLKNLSFNNNNINNPFNNTFSNNSNNNVNNFNIPQLENIPNEKIRENYAKLFQQFKEMQKDREQLLESLRIETLNNEEQRNYIEILKKTIDSSVIKHGLNPIIQHNKQNYYPQKNNIYQNQNNNGNLNGNKNNSFNNNLEVLIDICKLKTETEKSKKDLILSQILITELKQEIEFLHKTNEDLNFKKEKIKENLENGIFELEDSKERLRNLEAEKEEINQYNNNLLQNFEKLQEDLHSSNELLSKYEKELHENAKKINDLMTDNENNSIIQSKMLEYKKSFEKIYEDFEENLKIKNTFEAELIELKEELEIKRMEINRLKILNEEKEMKFESEKKMILNDNENINSRNKKAERNLNDIENLLKEREREVLKYQDKFNDCELMNQEFKKKLENLELDFIDYKKTSERKLEATEKTVRELMSNNTIIKANLDNMNIEKENLLNEIDNLANNNEILCGNVNDLESELNSKGKNLNKINQEYEKLFKDYTELENERKIIKTEREALLREIKQIKDHYENEVSDKIMENNRLNKDINFLKNEVYDHREKNCEAKE